jgi:hypothetical protein
MAVTRIGLVALVASLGLNAALVAARYRAPSGAQGAVPASGGAGAAGAPGAEEPSAPSDPACPERLALHEEIDRAAQELRRVAPADRLFRMGAPNDVARARLAPVIERALAGAAGAGSHTLECRDQVCRLSIFQREAEDANAWSRALQDPRRELLSRYTRDGIQFTGGGRVSDPITGERLTRRDGYIRLANADGAPLGEEAGGGR